MNTMNVTVDGRTGMTLMCAKCGKPATSSINWTAFGGGNGVDRWEALCAACNPIKFPTFERERDLTSALSTLVRHYKRHTPHRCEILEDAEAVLEGKPYPHFDPDDVN